MFFHVSLSILCAWMHLTCALLLVCEESIDYCSCLKLLECVSSKSAKKSLDFLKSSEVCYRSMLLLILKRKKHNALIFHEMFYVLALRFFSLKTNCREIIRIFSGTNVSSRSFWKASIVELSSLKRDKNQAKSESHLSNMAVATPLKLQIKTFHMRKATKKTL